MKFRIDAKFDGDIWKPQAVIEHRSIAEMLNFLAFWRAQDGQDDFRATRLWTKRELRIARKQCGRGSFP